MLWNGLSLFQRWEEVLSGSVAVGSAELFVTAAKNERVLGNHSAFCEKNSKNILLIGIKKVNLLISQSGKVFCGVFSQGLSDGVCVVLSDKQITVQDFVLELYK